MALTISKLKMWKDPGYTKGCLEVPPVGSKKLPGTPDYTLPADQTLRPHKASTLTSLQLPIDFTSVFGMSYLYIEASDGSGSVSLFGWVDSITQVASSHMNTQINWTVDWWRSYSDAITFGTGTITHCPDSTYKRPYQTQPRLWKVKHKERIMAGVSLINGIDTPGSEYTTYKYCVVVVYNTIVGGSTVIGYMYWRTNLTTSEKYTSGGTDYYGMTIQELFTGRFDETFGLNPNDVIGIFITPFEPFKRDTLSVVTANYGGQDFFAYVKKFAQSGVYATVTLTNTYESDDYLKTVIVDPMGSVVYTLPWGYKVNRMNTFTDAGTIAANMCATLYFNTDTYDHVALPIEGKMFTIPSIAVPFNSNAYSSYNYSGQREYDREVKNIQRDEQNDSGVIGIASSALGASPSGLLSGIVSTPLNYFTQGTINDRLNDATDKLYSNQASSVIQSGGGMGFSFDSIVPGDWYIVQMEADAVSEAEYTAHIAKNGYSTDISAASCSSFITTGGALQITNMVVTGNAPPEAKQFIKGMFTNGVIIQENNPSGVAP